MRFDGLAELFALLLAAAQPNGATPSDVAGASAPAPIALLAPTANGPGGVPNSNISRERAKIIRLSRLPCRTGFQLAAFIDEPWARSGDYAQRCSVHAGISDFN